MKNIFKGLGLGFMALALSLSLGVSSANATSTYAVGGITETGALTITGGTTLALNGAAGSAITLGAVTDTGSITIGGALTSGALTLGNVSQTSPVTVYGGGTGNGLNVIHSGTTIAGTESHGLDVTSTATLASGKNLVGVNSVVTTAGTSGTWASGVYGQVVQTGAQHVSGYMSGGEFEVKNTYASAANEMFSLVLDANSNTYHPSSAFLWAQDFGSAAIPNLLNISTNGGTIGTNSATSLVSTYATDQVPTHSLKIMINGTPYWIQLTSVAPH